MPNVIVSTCGTSILTNQADDELRGLLGRTANKQEPELSPDEKDAIDRRVEDREQVIQEADHARICRLSAELKGVIAYYGGWVPDSARQDMHFLLHSDTYQGRAVAPLLEAWLRGQGLTVSCVIVEDLRTDDLDCFRSAMSWLARWCVETLPGYREQQYNVVFNLSGGFKSVNGYLQTIGALYADQTVYIFESSDALLRIPRLPVTIDLAGNVARNERAFRRLAAARDVSVKECEGIPESMVLRLEGQRTCALSVFGELGWAEWKRANFGADLLDPLSDKLIISQPFRHDVGGLTAERRAIVNERLDQLSVYLDSGMQHCPRSLSFHKLSGPAGDSTHECNAWSDQDARRIRGHFDDDHRFVLDCLWPHP